MKRALFLLGRALYGGYFVYNGINHFWEHDKLAGYAGSKGVPAPDVAVSGTGVMMLAGGASVLVGFQPTIGAGLILGFLLGVSPQIHDFWNIQNPAERASQMINFTKNLGLVGATLMVTSIEEPWPVSVGELLPHEEQQAARRAA